MFNTLRYGLAKQSTRVVVSTTACHDRALGFIKMQHCGELRDREFSVLRRMSGGYGHLLQ